MDIVTAASDEKTVMQIAGILLDGFSDTGTEAWSTIEECLKEVHESLAEDKISRIAFGDGGVVVGWIVGAATYHGYVWELEILVVRRDSRLKGIGRKLVEDFEEQVKGRDGITILLDTDDENSRTSLGGIDLYPDPLEHLVNIENLGNHPFEFYQKMGYSLVGVLPDANGFGKPDIYMTKRIS